MTSLTEPAAERLAADRRRTRVFLAADAAPARPGAARELRGHCPADDVPVRAAAPLSIGRLLGLDLYLGPTHCSGAL